MSNPTTQCRSCKAEIAFLETKKGNKIPVDAESLSDEDLEELGGPDGVVDFRPGEHVSHFSTCPDAKEHRKSR